MMFEHVVDVYYLTTGTDAGGGTTNSYTLRQSGVACLLNVQAGGNPEMFGQQQQTDTITGATFYTGIQRGDKVVVTAGPSLVGASIHLTNTKDQPGVDALGFDEIVHFMGERLA